MTEFAILRYSQFTTYGELVEIDHWTEKRLYYRRYITHYDVRRDRVPTKGERPVYFCDINRVQVRNATPELFAELVAAEDAYDTVKRELLTELKNDYDSECKKIIEAAGGIVHGKGGIAP